MLNYVNGYCYVRKKYYFCVMILDLLRYILLGLLVLVGICLLRFITNLLVYFLGYEVTALIGALVFLVCFVWLCFEVEK